MSDRVLDRIQTAIENIARVMDEHGNVEVGGPAPSGSEEEDQPYYSLAIAETYLKEAEVVLEQEAIESDPEVVLIYDTVVNVHVRDGQVTSVHVDDENLRFNRELTTENQSLASVDAALSIVDEVDWPAWDFGY